MRRPSLRPPRSRVRAALCSGTGRRDRRGRWDDDRSLRRRRTSRRPGASRRHTRPPRSRPTPKPVSPTSSSPQGGSTSECESAQPSSSAGARSIPAGAFTPDSFSTSAIAVRASPSAPGRTSRTEDVGIRDKPSVLGKRRPLRHHDQHTAGVHELQLRTQKPCVLGRPPEQPARRRDQSARRSTQRAPASPHALLPEDLPPAAEQDAAKQGC